MKKQNKKRKKVRGNEFSRLLQEKRIEDQQFNAILEHLETNPESDCWVFPVDAQLFPIAARAAARVKKVPKFSSFLFSGTAKVPGISGLAIVIECPTVDQAA